MRGLLLSTDHISVTVLRDQGLRALKNMHVWSFFCFLRVSSGTKFQKQSLQTMTNIRHATYTIRCCI